MEQFSSAFHHLLVSIKHNPQNAQAYMYLGISLKDLGDNANAYNAFTRAVSLEPENHLIYLNFALFLTDSENPDTVEMAKENFQKHLELFSIYGLDPEEDQELQAQR